MSRRVMTRRKRSGLAFFLTWMVVGLYLDGWAHETRQPESFLSPWHAIGYTGFVGAVLFWIWDSYRERQPIMRSFAVDKVAFLGLGIFVTGALSDLVWHELLGSEVDIEALLSPPHLLLMFGAILAVTAPIRSAWQIPEDTEPSFSSFLPTLVAFTTATAIVSFALMFLSAFDPGTHPAKIPTSQPLTATAPLTLGGVHQVWGMASILVTNLVLMVPACLILRRWIPPPGSFTIFFLAIPIGISGINSFERFPLIGSCLAAGMVADTSARWFVRWRRGRMSLVFASATPLTLWSLWMTIHGLLYGLNWPAELIGGMITLTTLMGFGVGLLVFGSATRAAAPG